MGLFSIKSKPTKEKIEPTYAVPTEEPKIQDTETIDNTKKSLNEW